MFIWLNLQLQLTCIRALYTAYPLICISLKKGKRKLKTVLARVPDLPKGDYTLRIVTRFSNASTSLKEARTIEYARLLTVK